MTSSVSREAYGEALEQLAANTVAATAPQLATVADEILSVAGLLRAQPRLRRALTDPSRPGSDRAGLLKSLLAGKVSEITVNTVAALAAGRFSRPSELLDAAERLGVEALLTSAEREDKLADVEDELFRFGQIVGGDSKLAVTLGDVSAPVELRVKLVQDLLKGKVHVATGRLVEVALTGFGGRGFEASLTRLVEATAAKRDREVAYVTVAKPLTDADEQSLAAKLSALYGREVSLKVDVDPSVLGGVSVRVGSDLYDGTVLRKLNQAKQAFAK
ncbi:F0F1 ATP synthase subunit delta [Actinoplanes utahensis]|uniref:ATP synthase subunit delta n=1 Tax=Actinoplanes utahensis TaxID=1869 RepID=A0A0A6XAI5_ACTUT|nr:F0F1 ATP synthase subunit delta [Actinoplanes utahensis]KHD77117.1 ATP synthase subunit delta [Actinoplanes utahensis]GIF33012.1 ATP synthase subunit delta [Actinoplanes utahensis]